MGHTVVIEYGKDYPDPIEAEGALELRLAEMESRLLTPAQLDQLPEPEPLVDGMLFRDSLAWLSGKWGQGKSFVALDLACSIATGLDWHGRTVQAGRVLYVVAEGAIGMSARRQAWEMQHGVPAAAIRFLVMPVQLTDPTDLAAFGALLAKTTPTLVVIDTQARCSVGSEENSSKDMGRLVDGLETLRAQCHACFLVVHHEGRGGEHMRGSTALEGAATSILRSQKDGDAVTVMSAKQKDAPEADPIELQLIPMGKSMVLDDNRGFSSAMPESEYRVLNLVAETRERGVTQTELRDAADLSKTTWHRAINSLINSGKVLRVKEGRTTRFVLPAHNRQSEMTLPVDNSPETVDNSSHSARGTFPQWTDESHESHHEPTEKPPSDLPKSQSATRSQDPPGESQSPTPPIGGGTPMEPGHETPRCSVCLRTVHLNEHGHCYACSHLQGDA